VAHPPKAAVVPKSTQATLDTLRRQPSEFDAELDCSVKGLRGCDTFDQKRDFVEERTLNKAV
jgi:hypothetical protein